MKRIDEVMSREQRQQFANRVEVLEKVKALLLVSQLCMATTEQVAEYFGVPVDTIRSICSRNKEELEANGAAIFTEKQLLEQKLQNATSVRESRSMVLYDVDGCIFEVNNRGIRLFTPRAILCLAMMLRDSAVAAEIRTQLLNLAEAAPAEEKIANIQSQETAMLQFARAMMEGNSASIAQAVKDLMALKDHTIAAQAASISRLSGEKTVLEEKAATLTEKNESLTASNHMLSEKAITWEPRRVANAIVRKIARAVYNGKYGLAWNEFYRELMYQTGISVGQRGAGKNESGLDTIRDEEWPKVMKVIASLACHYCIDVVEVTNEKVVEVYSLDRVETENGIRYNTGIMRTIRSA